MVASRFVHGLMSARPSTGGIAAAASDRQHDALGGPQHLIPHPDRALALQPGVAADERDAAVLEPRQLSRIVQLVDDLVAATQDGGHVEPSGHRLRGAGDAACLGQRLGRAQQALGRHAGVVGAFAADELALDEGDVEAVLASASGGDLAGRAGADDDHVEVGLGHGRVVLPGRRPLRTRARRLSFVTFGAWRSLVARTVRVGEVPSSNLGAPIAVPSPRGGHEPLRGLALCRELAIAAATDLIAHLDELLDAASFDDYGPNGLQVPGRDDVRTVVTGVSASRALLEQAVGAGADLVLVHHGLFWGERGPLDRETAGRLKVLLDADVGLAAYHLPLDAHLEVGNNALLAGALGATDVERFAAIGVRATFAPAIDAGDAPCARARGNGTRAAGVPGRPREIASLAIVSGAGASLLGEAIAAGVDAFITGEPREPAMASARENAIHFLAAGHHATERLGVQALGERWPAPTACDTSSSTSRIRSREPASFLGTFT